MQNKCVIKCTNHIKMLQYVYFIGTTFLSLRQQQHTLAYNRIYTKMTKKYLKFIAYASLNIVEIGRYNGLGPV